jgi:hypothetical protein
MKKLLIFLSFLILFLSIFFSYLSLLHSESNISPTAHYTSYIWIKSSLSPRQFQTTLGVILFYLLEPFMLISRLLSGPTIENMLLARHLKIDERLTTWIERYEEEEEKDEDEEEEEGKEKREGKNEIKKNEDENDQKKEKKKITTVIEIASGLSGRGLRFLQKYSNLTYIETDFDDMIQLKYQLCQQISQESQSNLSTRHFFVPLNALLSTGPQSLSSVIETKTKSNEGIVIITEGLLAYFSQSQMDQFWSVLSSEFQFSSNQPRPMIYLTDIHVLSDIDDIYSSAFKGLLSWFVGSEVNSQYKSINHLIQSLAPYFKSNNQKNNEPMINLYQPIDGNGKASLKGKSGAEKVLILEISRL